MPRRHSPHTTDVVTATARTRGPLPRQLHQQARRIPLHAFVFWAKGAPPGNVDRLDLERCRADALSSVNSPPAHTGPPHVNI